MSLLLLLLALSFVMAVSAQVFVDDYVRPQSMFYNLLAGTIITTLGALFINIRVSPE